MSINQTITMNLDFSYDSSVANQTDITNTNKNKLHSMLAFANEVIYKKPLPHEISHMLG